MVLAPLKLCYNLVGGMMYYEENTRNITSNFIYNSDHAYVLYFCICLQ